MLQKVVHVQVKKHLIMTCSEWLRSLWPDPPYEIVVAKRGTNGIKKETILFKDVTDARKSDWILDVGARTNTLVEALQGEGYSRAFGIDVSPLIIESRFGIHGNIRDVNYLFRFHHVWLDHVLEYFRGGIFADYDALSRFRGGILANYQVSCENASEDFERYSAPTLAMLARKLNSLLLPGGTIYIVDDEDNARRFEQEVSRMAYGKRVKGLIVAFCKPIE